MKINTEKEIFTVFLVCQRSSGAVRRLCSSCWDQKSERNWRTKDRKTPQRWGAEGGRAYLHQYTAVPQAQPHLCTGSPGGDLAFLPSYPLLVLQPRCKRIFFLGNKSALPDQGGEEDVWLLSFAEMLSGVREGSPRQKRQEWKGWEQLPISSCILTRRPFSQALSVWSPQGILHPCSFTPNAVRFAFNKRNSGWG